METTNPDAADTPPAFVYSGGPSVPSEAQQAALKSVHLAGSWATFLGACNIVVLPLVEALLYTPADAHGYSKTALVTSAFIIGIIIGAIFIAIGIKLRHVTAETLLRAGRTLLIFNVVIAVIAILNLLGGGGGIGLLNLVALFISLQALTKVRKLKASS